MLKIPGIVILHIYLWFLHNIGYFNSIQWFFTVLRLLNLAFIAIVHGHMICEQFFDHTCFWNSSSLLIFNNLNSFFSFLICIVSKVQQRTLIEWLSFESIKTRDFCIIRQIFTIKNIVVVLIKFIITRNRRKFSVSNFIIFFVSSWVRCTTFTTVFWWIVLGTISLPVLMLLFNKVSHLDGKLLRKFEKCKK